MANRKKLQMQHFIDASCSSKKHVAETSVYAHPYARAAVWNNGPMAAANSPPIHDAVRGDLRSALFMIEGHLQVAVEKSR